MQIRFISVGAHPLVLLLVLHSYLPADEVENLVVEAFRAELQGDMQGRSRRLEAALSQNPSCAEAHWQLGHVRVEDRWLPLSDAEEIAAGDAHLQKYTQMREVLGNTLVGHRTLAKYCLKHKLDARALFHLSVLRQAQPQDEDVAKAFRALIGRMRREDKLPELRAPSKETRDKQARLASQAREDWNACAKVVGRLERAIRRNNEEEREAAFAELKTLRDHPTTIDILLARIDNEDLQHEFIAEFCGQDTAATTQCLLRRAIFSESPELRQAACAALKGRPLDTYVTQLVSGLAATIEFTPYVLGNGLDGLRAGYLLYREGMMADLEIDSSQSRLEGIAGLDRTLINRFAGTARISLGTLAEQAAAENARSRVVNERIYEVLAATTEVELAPTPDAWWNWWLEYTERDGGDQKPVISRVSHTLALSHSCFMPGTLVWTETGPRAIDKMHVGERVLAQDIQTGELGYRFVLDVTVRPPRQTVRLLAGDSNVATSLGHAFWQVGKGWTIAKYIQPGVMLRTASGPLSVMGVEEGPESQVYNLVVDGVHTFFVGHDRLLVHDITFHEPYTPPLPGFRQQPTVTSP